MSTSKSRPSKKVDDQKCEKCSAKFHSKSGKNTMCKTCRAKKEEKKEKKGKKEKKDDKKKTKNATDATSPIGSPSPQWRVEGSKVEVNCQMKGKYYPGIITRVRTNGTCDIAYEDGKKEQGVEADTIRAWTVPAASDDAAKPKEPAIAPAKAPHLFAMSGNFWTGPNPETEEEERQKKAAVDQADQERQAAEEIKMRSMLVEVSAPSE
jgi:hypothetical protein